MGPLALVMSANIYEDTAKEQKRSLMEVMSSQSVTTLARMVMDANATEATFEAKGVTVCGEPKGNWRVTIEQTKEAAQAIEARSGETAQPVRSEGRKRGPQGCVQTPQPEGS